MELLKFLTQLKYNKHITLNQLEYDINQLKKIVDNPKLKFDYVKPKPLQNYINELKNTATSAADTARQKAIAAYDEIRKTIPEYKPKTNVDDIYLILGFLLSLEDDDFDKYNFENQDELLAMIGLLFFSDGDGKVDGKVDGNDNGNNRKENRKENRNNNENNNVNNNVNNINIPHELTANELLLIIQSLTQSSEELLHKKHEMSNEKNALLADYESLGNKYSELINLFEYTQENAAEELDKNYQEIDNLIHYQNEMEEWLKIEMLSVTDATEANRLSQIALDRETKTVARLQEVIQEERKFKTTLQEQLKSAAAKLEENKSLTSSIFELIKKILNENNPEGNKNPILHLGETMDKYKKTRSELEESRRMLENTQHELAECGRLEANHLAEIEEHAQTILGLQNKAVKSELLNNHFKAISARLQGELENEQFKKVELDKQLAESEEEVHSMNDVLDRFRGLIKESNEKADAAERRVKDAEKRATDAELLQKKQEGLAQNAFETIQKDAAELAASKEELAAAQKELIETTSALHIKESQRIDIEDHYHDLLRQHRALEEKNKALDKNRLPMIELLEERNRTIDSLREKDKAQVKRIADLVAAATKLSDKSSADFQRITAELDAAKATFADDIKSQKAMFEENIKRIKDKSDDIHSGLQKQIVDLTSQLQHANETIKGLEQEVANKNEEIKRENDSSLNLRGQVDTLKGEVKTLKGEISTLTKELQSAIKIKNNAESATVNISDENKRITEELTKFIEKSTILQQRNIEFDKIINKQKLQIAELSHNAELSSRKFDALAKEKSSIASLLKSANSEIDSLKENKREEKPEKDKLVGNLAKLKKDNEGFLLTLSRIRAENAEYQATIAKIDSNRRDSTIVKSELDSCLQINKGILAENTALLAEIDALKGLLEGFKTLSNKTPSHAPITPVPHSATPNWSPDAAQQRVTGTKGP